MNDPDPLLPETIEQFAPAAPGHGHRLAIREHDFAVAVAERLRLLYRVEADDGIARYLVELLRVEPERQ